MGAFQGEVEIPAWEELLRHSGEKSQDPHFLRKVELIKLKPRPWLWQFGRAVIQLLLHDPSIKKFVNSSHGEVVDIIAAQVAENNHMRAQTDLLADELSPMLNHYQAKCDRSYRQQPCTAITTLKRATMASKFCEKNDPILLLGDDDMVGLALAKNGFTDVSVLDVDPKILGIIREVCQKEKLEIKLFHHDLNNPIPKKYLQNYRLVFLDPDYSIEGLKTFLGAAQEFSVRSDDPVFFLSVHLMSLLRKGLQQLLPFTRSVNLQVSNFFPSFNSYPIPPGVKNLIGLVNRTVASSPVLRSEGNFPYFVSDALVLKRWQS